MKREDILQQLMAFAGPVGPPVGVYDSSEKSFGEEMEEETRNIRQWVHTLPMESLTTVIDIFMHPPRLHEFRQNYPSDITLKGLPAVFDMVFAQFMIRDRDEFVRQCEPYLHYEKMREEMNDVEETVDDFRREDLGSVHHR